MKKIFLTVLVVISALFGVFVSACKTGGEQDDTGYTVTLSKQTLSLGTFERFELTAIVRDAENNETQQKITWQSTDESVAKVADGQIFAMSAGTTEISATLNNSASAKCIVTVTDNGVIPELRVNTKNLSIGKGQQFTVISQVFFNGNDCTESDTVFTYKSANSSIATVSEDGIVTATATGNTKITVYALWRGIGGPDRISDESAIVALMQTIDVNVIDV